MTRILVVEDERDLALALRVNLEVEGYEARLAYTGAEGIRAARADAPDLVILDLMLPDTDGYAVLAAVRAAGSDVPVIMLTARGEEVDKVRGFRAGADDYVTKPFGVMELLVRIQAVLRRVGVRSRVAPDPAVEPPVEAAPRLVHRVGDVEVDVDARLVRRGGTAVVLTPKAFELLLALVARRGRVVSRHEMLREVWGYDASVTTRTVDAHIAELRRKLATLGAAELVATVWKVGYRLRE